MKSIIELIREFKSGDGYRVYEGHIQLEILQKIINKNFLIIQNHIKKYEQYVASIPKGKFPSSRKSRTFRIEFLRLLISYTGSIYSVEQATKHFFKTDEKTDFKTCIETFEALPERLILFAFRNHLTHTKLLNISNTFGYSAEPEGVKKVGEFVVNRRELLDDLANNEQSALLKYEKDRIVLEPYLRRKYKGQLNIDMKEAITAGQRKLTEFCNEIRETIGKYYQKDLDERLLLREKIRRMQGKR